MNSTSIPVRVLTSDMNSESEPYHPRVTRTIKPSGPDAYRVPSAALDGQELRSAALLSLSLLPATAEAIALVDEITAQVAEREAKGRQRQRGAQKQGDLRRAVGALVGDILRRWASDTPRPVSRSESAETFTDAAISRRDYCAARDALLELGLIHRAEGKRFSLGPGFDGDLLWRGWTTRMWPTAALLSRAEAHGLTPATVRSAFRAAPPKKAPAVRHPVVLRALSERRHGRKIQAANLPVDASIPEVRVAIEAVDRQNALAARTPVMGCIPPCWFRAYRGGWRLGGRWVAEGRDLASVYLTMSEADRLRDLRIAGEPVAEVDATASHLTILHGLAGVPLPEGDLYAVGDDLPRQAVKRWTTVSIGLGRAQPRWHRGATDEDRQQDAAAIHAAMLARYPVLRDMRSIVPADLGREHGNRADILTLHLQWIEAEALTLALGLLAEKGVLALPTHDGLIVAQSVVGPAKEALTAGYSQKAGVAPRLDVSWGDAAPGRAAR